MRRRIKITLLAVMAIFLILWAGHATIHLYRSLTVLHLPTHETREPFGRKVNGWMNVEQVARHYRVTTSDVFVALEIKPEPGDSKLTLKELTEKYNKSPAEVEAALNSINNSVPSRGGRIHG